MTMTYHAVELMGACEDVCTLGMVPRPALRVWQSHLDGVVFVKSNEIVPWLKFWGIPC